MRDRRLGLDRGLLGATGGGQVDGRLVRLGLLAVVRLDLVRVALLPARLALGELLVEVPGVEQDEGRQLDRARPSRGSAPLKPAPHQHRQQPAVVEVGVGQHDRVEVAGLEPERDPVADRLVGAALEHPAVDEDAGALGGQQELGAGDGRGATEELDVHGAHGDRRDPTSGYRPGRVP